MKIINVAIIGAGEISHAHISGYLTLSDECKVIALCDISLDKLEETKRRCNLNVDSFSDYRKLLKRSDIDLVSICTSPNTHAMIAIDFLNAGKNVLVEKPMALSLEECDAMNEAAERNNKILSVVAQNRFTNPIMKLKKVLDSKLTGPILHVQVDSFWWRGLNYYDLWWRGNWEKEGGGCTISHAVHHIDILQWLNGVPSEIRSVLSNTSHENSSVEDLSIALAQYKNGSLAQITSSIVHHGQEQQIIIQGKHARVSAPWKVTSYKSTENGFPEQDIDVENKIQEIYNQQPNLKYEGHTGQIYDVLNAIKDNGKVLVDGTQGRNTIEIITAIYISATYGSSVKFPIKKSNLFYTKKGIEENVISFKESNN